jgi:kynurenine formamidase
MGQAAGPSRSRRNLPRGSGRPREADVAKKIRGVTFEENLNNSMGLEFYNLSHRFGYQSPNWPYFEDVKIERIHYMAKSGVLSQRITTSMHNTTHIDAPAHVVQGTPFIDEVPLPHFFGSGIVVSIPKKKWEQITYDDLEKAAGKIVRPRDVVIVNTGWHKLYEDSEDYFCRAPGFVPSAGEWFVEKKVKVVGHDTQANDHPLATAIGPQRNGPLHPHLADEYKKWSGGRDWKDDFPEWEPVHRILFKNGILGIENVGGDIDKVTGKRCTFAFFPWNWDRGDGCIIRLVAIVDPKGSFRIEKGEKFA